MFAPFAPGTPDALVPAPYSLISKRATKFFSDSANSCGKGDQHVESRVVLDGRTELTRQPIAGDMKAMHPDWEPGMKTVNASRYAVAEQLALAPENRAVGGWRGHLAVQRAHPAYAVASRVIDRSMKMAHRLRGRPDILHNEWCKGDQALEEMLGTCVQQQQAKSISLLANFCRDVLEAQPSLVRVAPPVKVFGDIHGQLRDVLLLFMEYGMPTHLGGDVQAVTYVFNGDFVDRGLHQLEVVVLLFALKIMYPEAVYLLRGNHEFRMQNIAMEKLGLKHHLSLRMPEQPRLFDLIHVAFDWLPIAALCGGAALVLHGGIGDGSWSLKDLEAVQRPVRSFAQSRVVMHAVWSDPADSDAAMRAGVHLNSARGGEIPEFGLDISDKWCHKNKIGLIIRSHQFCKEGFKVLHGGKVVTVFSARNYFSDETLDTSNDCALLLLAQDPNGHMRVYPKRLAATPVSSRGRQAGGVAFLQQVVSMLTTCCSDMDDQGPQSAMPASASLGSRKSSLQYSRW